MAIVTTYTTRSGIDLSNAYIKINRAAISSHIVTKSDVSTKQFDAAYELIVYASADGYEKGTPAVEKDERVCPIDINSDVLSQCYAHLKTIYTDAIDK